jgi:hypothetical protein
VITIKEEFLTCTKLRRAIRAGGYEVLATWLAMKAYADRRGDGFIADELFDDLAGLPPKARKSLTCLVECGDPHRISDGTLQRGSGLVDQVEGGWELHDYEDHGVSHDVLEDRRRQARERKAVQRKRRSLVLERDGHRCRYCGLGLESGLRLEIDHVIPMSLGGSSELENLVTACANCNNKKQGRTPEQAGMQLLPEKAQCDSHDPVRDSPKRDRHASVRARSSPPPSSPQDQDRSGNPHAEDPTGFPRAHAKDGVCAAKRDSFAAHLRNLTEQPEIVRAFKRWQEVLGKTGTLLDELKAQTLEERQREGMTEQDLDDVLAAVKASDWYMADPHRQQIRFVFGDRQRYETLVEIGRGLRNSGERKRRQYWRPSPEEEEARRNAVPMPDDVRERVEKAVGKLRGV